MAVTGKTAAIEDALHSRLLALVLSPARRVAWPRQAFTPLQSEVYLQPTVFWNNSERGEIGPAAARRHVGIYQVTVRGPTAGDFTQDQVADALIEHFDRQAISRNGLVVRIGSFNGAPAVPWRSQSFPDGGWQVIPVSIPFWCDVFPS